MPLSNYIDNAVKNRMASKRSEIVSKALLMIANGFPSEMATGGLRVSVLRIACIVGLDTMLYVCI
jgi:metal-responsive CopG/Arc/MetJ family transcriptional regulator